MNIRSNCSSCFESLPEDLKTRIMLLAGPDVRWRRVSQSWRTLFSKPFLIFQAVQQEMTGILPVLRERIEGKQKLLKITTIEKQLETIRKALIRCIELLEGHQDILTRTNLQFNLTDLVQLKTAAQWVNDAHLLAFFSSLFKTPSTVQWINPNLSAKNLRSWLAQKPIQKELENVLDFTFDGHNQYCFIPKEILYFKNLLSLKIQNINLVALPYFIADFQHLRTLNLNDCKLQSFPTPTYFPQNLQILTLKGNQIKKIPYSIIHLSQLKHLNLSSNQLVELPPVIGQMQNLTKLAAQKNSISVIADSIFMLINLKILDLRDNEVDDLPKIGYLPNLTKLKLQNNPIHLLTNLITIAPKAVIDTDSRESSDVELCVSSEEDVVLYT